MGLCCCTGCRQAAGYHHEPAVNVFSAMSGSTVKHDFDFHETFSFVLNAKHQEDVDYYIILSEVIINHK